MMTTATMPCASAMEKMNGGNDLWQKQVLVMSCSNMRCCRQNSARILANVATACLNSLPKRKYYLCSLGCAFKRATCTEWPGLSPSRCDKLPPSCASLSRDGRQAEQQPTAVQGDKVAADHPISRDLAGNSKIIITFRFCDNFCLNFHGITSSQDVGPESGYLHRYAYY